MIFKERIPKDFREKRIEKVFYAKCKACSHNFRSHCSRSIYCSTQCKSRTESRIRVRKTETRICQRCEKPFRVRADTKTVFCGHVCGYFKVGR